MVYTHLAAAILAAALAGWGAWSVQSWRLGEQIAVIKAAQLEAVNTATREARATESRRYQEVHDAQVKSAQRATQSRRAADVARDSGDRLRDDIAAALRTSEESAAACHQYAAAVSGLFDQCQGDFGAMAERAQGHSNDVMLLQESWPR